ncbi:hypothetical protein tb265_34910 [Gemmatimonadetes bacterium T265]|nr:hypothetical protein tb265_34910 [Gemmatimonadetes bacterium T265]
MSASAAAAQGRAAHGSHAGEVVHDAVVALEELFRPPPPLRGGLFGAGLSARGERWFERISWAVVVLFAVAWALAIVMTPRRQTGAGEAPRFALTPATASVTAALTNADRPSTAYLTDAFMTRLAGLRGASGKVRIVVHAPGEPVAPQVPGVTTADGNPSSPIERLALRIGDAIRPVADLNVLTLTPLSARRRGRIGLYYVGAWPTEKGAVAARGNYAPPRGLIQVTPATEDTPLSEHLRLRDFLTHDQVNVWPKYVVVDPRIVDKDELVLAELAKQGIPAGGLHVMSGFRTPQYNAGGGDPTGRAGLSRHMYGDANDVWIDNTGGGQMDDLNHDGRRDIRDARVICDAVERVEQAHPELVGGCGVYPGNGAHGPFTHIDARGYRARWTGSGDGG